MSENENEKREGIIRKPDGGDGDAIVLVPNAFDDRCSSTASLLSSDSSNDEVVVVG